MILWGWFRVRKSENTMTRPSKTTHIRSSKNTLTRPSKTILRFSHQGVFLWSCEGGFLWSYEGGLGWCWIVLSLYFLTFSSGWFLIVLGVVFKGLSSMIFDGLMPWDKYVCMLLVPVMVQSDGHLLSLWVTSFSHEMMQMGVLVIWVKTVVDAFADYSPTPTQPTSTSLLTCTLKSLES